MYWRTGFRFLLVGMSLLALAACKPRTSATAGFMVTLRQFHVLPAEYVKAANATALDSTLTTAFSPHNYFFQNPLLLGHILELYQQGKLTAYRADTSAEVALPYATFARTLLAVDHPELGEDAEDEDTADTYNWAAIISLLDHHVDWEGGLLPDTSQQPPVRFAPQRLVLLLFDEEGRLPEKRVAYLRYQDLLAVKAFSETEWPFQKPLEAFALPLVPIAVQQDEVEDYPSAVKVMAAALQADFKAMEQAAGGTNPTTEEAKVVAKHLAQALAPAFPLNSLQALRRIPAPGYQTLNMLAGPIYAHSKQITPGKLAAYRALHNAWVPALVEAIVARLRAQQGKLYLPDSFNALSHAQLATHLHLIADRALGSSTAEPLIRLTPGLKQVVEVLGSWQRTGSEAEFTPLFIRLIHVDNSASIPEVAVLAVPVQEYTDFKVPGTDLSLGKYLTTQQYFSYPASIGILHWQGPQPLWEVQLAMPGLAEAFLIRYYLRTGAWDKLYRLPSYRGERLFLDASRLQLVEQEINLQQAPA